MKKNFRKSILLTLGLTTVMTAGLALAACGNIVPFVEEEVKKGPQFLEGALSEIAIGDTIVLDEYVDYSQSDNFTLTLKDEAGEETDMTEEYTWYPEEPGTYVLTYTIHSGQHKGTASFTFYVAYPTLSWQFTLSGKPYNLGDELVFEEYFTDLDIYVPIDDYEVIMDGVEIGGTYIDLTEEESHVFESMDDHIFMFHVESPDGQRCDAREIISVKCVDEAALAMLEAMNATTYGELYLREEGETDDKYVSSTLLKGMYNGGVNNGSVLSDKTTPHDVPYLAYNGDYGLNDYIKIDFTGKNMPIMSFFRGDDYKNNIFDHTKGFVVSGGFTNNSGVPIHADLSKKFYLYGPNMVSKYDENYPGDNTQSLGAISNGDNAYPGSIASLDEDTQYRLIAGFTGLRKGNTQHVTTRDPMESLYLTFSCLVLDLTNKEVFSEFTIETYALQACGYDFIPMDLENNSYLQGNIVLYGNYGVQTTWDRLYPVIQDKTYDQMFAEEVAQASFKQNAKKFVFVGKAANVSDFVDVQGEYSMFYRDEAGNDTPITGDTFTIHQEGNYTLFYKHGDYYYGTLRFFVGGNEYKTTTDANGRVVLGSGSIGNGGSYTGPNSNDLIDQAYKRIEGEYSFDDYIAFDFTGKNMPEIAFFAGDFNQSMYSQYGGKQGVVVASGVTLWDGSGPASLGSNGTQICVSGPYMANYSAATKDGGNLMNAFGSKLARANLADGTRYRVIMGFTKATDTRAITLRYALYNLDTGALVEEKAMDSWNMFSNPDYFEQSRDTLVGSIILYGKFRAETTIDKLWGVYEDTTIADVAAAIQAAQN